jgi:hypothetical protein
VIGQIIGLFASDLKQNILFVFIFADNDKPKVLS